MTINRPEARNAIDASVTRGLGQALEYADRDIETRVVVLTGAGTAFCAGADLRAMARGEVLTPKDIESWGFAGMVKHQISKPIISAVNGLALGGGAELVLASDLAIASDRAIFGFPEVRHGIFAAAGGAVRLADHVPEKHAMKLLLTGDHIDASTAQALGIVNEVVVHDDLMASTMELAECVAANAPLAVQVSKRLLRKLRDDDGGLTTSIEEHHRWSDSDAAKAMILATIDAQEGPRAFAEKRKPRWIGR